MLRPLSVDVHQCTCGYASVFKQRAVRHAGSCAQGGRVTVLNRTIPADAPRGPAVGSDGEQRVWDAVIREYLATLAAHTPDNVVRELFEKFRARAANVCVRGSSVVEHLGDSERVTPLKKYCVWAAHDIAQRIARLDDSNEAASRLKSWFTDPLFLDDTSDATWVTALRSRHERRTEKMTKHSRAALRSLYTDLETILKKL